MFYIVVFVLLMLYALLRWLALTASPFILFGSGLWVSYFIDINRGILLICSAACIYLAVYLHKRIKLLSWSYQEGKEKNPEQNRGLERGRG